MLRKLYLRARGYKELKPTAPVTKQPSQWDEYKHNLRRERLLMHREAERGVLETMLERIEHETKIAGFVRAYLSND